MDKVCLFLELPLVAIRTFRSTSLLDADGFCNRVDGVLKIFRRVLLAIHGEHQQQLCRSHSRWLLPIGEFAQHCQEEMAGVCAHEQPRPETGPASKGRWQIDVVIDSAVAIDAELAPFDHFVGMLAFVLHTTFSMHCSAALWISGISSLTNDKM